MGIHWTKWECKFCGECFDENEEEEMRIHMRTKHREHFIKHMESFIYNNVKVME